MRGGNIRNLLSSFASKHWGKEVTTREVAKWIAENKGVDISVHRIAPRLHKHPNFRFKYRGRGKVWNVVGALELWVETLKDN